MNKNNNQNLSNNEVVDKITNKSEQELVAEKKYNEKQALARQKKAIKQLDPEVKKALKERLRLVKKLNKPHTGEETIPFENPENIIELKEVKKFYSNGYIVNEILKGIDLEIKKGQFVIILGPSGSGKTTLLNIISGLDRASIGVVNVAGNNLITFNDSKLTKFRKKNIAYVFQQYGLLPNLTVKENVEMGDYLQTNKDLKLDVLKILDDLGLSDHINKYPHQLSGGQQQRVSIARAFAKNTPIIFGDEPTGAIDEEMSKVVLQQFVDINKKHGTTVIIVTHNPIFADLANLVVKIKDGKISELITNEHPKSVEELSWGSE